MKLTRGTEGEGSIGHSCMRDIQSRRGSCSSSPRRRIREGKGAYPTDELYRPWAVVLGLRLTGPVPAKGHNHQPKRATDEIEAPPDNISQQSISE